ncbi:MAG: rubrerythrin [Bacteroidetes bacterium HGW-Bacteroidetes-6]|jgi:rubrerythrin|nr:MAG: rubrerythrin [Bacteroidetes bacterium HGW-Bacteroidetes-6]
MENNKALDILKTAILMEKRGMALYEEVVARTQSEEVKMIFQIMADEEKVHAKYLAEQFKSYMSTNTFTRQDLSTSDGDEKIVDMILSGNIKNQINAAGFEAAAIGAAIDMETKAIEVYRNRANESTDENEKALFNWLADWERGHYEVLLKLDNELKERIWADNDFWPF